MSNSILEGLIKEKDYSFKKLLYKIVNDFKFSIEELLLVIYFINQDKPAFDINKIKKITYMNEKNIMNAFASLTGKGLISISVVKQDDGKTNEVIDISNIYKAMVSDINSHIKAKNEENIFSLFEKEFGRPLSPIEFEIINTWLKADMAEELVIGALKEATFNGVSNLRYIDKIIYEWTKKGLKTMDDVNNHMKKRNDTESSKDLFDYNWLEDDE